MRSPQVEDERFAALVAALEPLESYVKGLIDEQQRAEEEQASQQSLKAIQKAFHEAMLALGDAAQLLQESVSLTD